MHQEERYLDEFWHHIDEHYVQRTGKAMHEILSGILSPRTLERTPEWAEAAVPAISSKSLPTDALIDTFLVFECRGSQNRRSCTNQGESQNTRHRYCAGQYTKTRRPTGSRVAITDNPRLQTGI